MSWCRSLRLPILLCVGVLLTGAMNPQSASPARLARMTAPIADREDPAATALLDAALQAINSQRVPWMQTHFWQRVHVPGLEYQSEGRYLAGPGHRVRLDLTVHVGGTAGQLQMISDGAICWQSEQIGSGSRTITKVDLQRVLDGLSNPGQEPQLRNEFFQAQAFGGPEVLLWNLRCQVRFARKEMVRWKGQPLIRIIGFSTQRADAGQPDAAFSPRECRLYLDPQTLWPCRLEWWGPAPQRMRDVLLVQMEFRDPQLPRQVPDQEFTFDPGTARVDDHTPQWEEAARSRSQELARTGR